MANMPGTASFLWYDRFPYASDHYRAPRPQSVIRQSYMQSSAASVSSYPEVNKGDMVQHKAFGRGLVLSVMKMGGDALLEIAFDEIGTKKLMAKTAFAHMRKL